MDQLFTFRIEASTNCKHDEQWSRVPYVLQQRNVHQQRRNWPAFPRLVHPDLRTGSMARHLSSLGGAFNTAQAHRTLYRHPARAPPVYRNVVLIDKEAGLSAVPLCIVLKFTPNSIYIRAVRKWPKLLLCLSIILSLRNALLDIMIQSRKAFTGILNQDQSFQS